MTQLLSVVNTVEEKTPATIGAGATIIHWTDREACTIIKVSVSGKSMIIQQDFATRTDDNGMSESQHYQYEPNPKGRTHEARLGKYGWRLKGSSGRRGTKVLVGVRDSYHDYSF